MIRSKFWKEKGDPESSKLSFQKESEIRSFPEVKSLRKFVANRPVFQYILKEFLRLTRKDRRW